MFVSAWACSPLPRKPGVCSPAQAPSNQVDPSDFFCSPFDSSHFTSLAPLLDAKSVTISSQMCSTRLESMVFAWSEVKRQVPSAQIYFSCRLVHFRLDPESKMFTSLCRIADLFPLSLSPSDMSPSWIHLCRCGKEMKKNLSLNPCMHEGKLKVFFTKWIF